ncbi:hemagglutinin repeat-containing protein [Janthinobacterium sp. SUN120]|uniref:hemagglutinin repeat-containing protein n=1 Tax=Janthinobacterium sp. SUN120 TaxID=3004099 RepID=UPI0025B0D3B9|nr:hemagglutinin repeat-containing protein [Janthinobacterium sp. SUN120]MDN2714552.1 hemagglutinin repeat-containing protein [Janthinobacterium sp. SUN120]
MNKNLYRIIFNKRRGQLMVVAENASSQGKAAKGEGGLDSGVFGGDGGGGVNAKLRPLALAIFGALGMVAFVAGPAMGQIVADPSAPGRQRPTVVQSANGVTQVNIQTPSAAGVSRNTYSQFDVTANGAILNNSRGNVQTQTGGWVQGNPWLAGGSARVILNEVNSANPSQLRGYVEVAGQRAEVVIANPAGVAIDGGGFINASRVTLTTGTPILNGGSLDGYMVQRGVVSINGRGLDTSLSDYTAILARAAQINGGIWAQELKVVTGANQIDAAHGVAGGIAGAGPAPAYALDVAQLGGMYAGKITLIGTEAGLGVRNAGVLAATAGNLVLQSNGWLSNSGNIQSAGAGSQTSIAVTGDVANSGTVYAGGDSQVQAQGNIANSGVIAAQGNAKVHATGAAARIDATAGSVLAAGLNLDNTLAASGKLSVSAGDTIAVHGTAVAGGDSSLAARQLDITGAQVAGGNISLGASAGDLDASRAQVTARDRLQLDAAHTVRSDAAQLTGQQLGVNAYGLSNVGGQIMQLGNGDLAIRLPGALDNTRGVIATNSQALRLQAASLSNQDGQIQHAGTGALEIGAAQVNLQRGSILSNGAMALTGEHIDHRDARTVAGQLSINAATLDNRGGSLAQSGQGATGVQVRGGLDNRGGALESNGALSVQAGNVQNQKGRIVSGTDVALSTGALDNTEATLAAGGKLRLDSGDVDNTRGQIQAVAGDAALTVAKLNNTAGSVFAGGNLATRANEVLNSGNLYAAGSQALQVSGVVSNSGVIAAQGDNRIDASRIDSATGSLLGAGIRADGSLAVSGQLQLTATQAIAAHGQNLAASKTSMHASAIDLSGSQTGGAAISLNASAGNVVTDSALVTTTGLLSVTAAGSGQALSNVRGTLSAGQLDITTGSLDNRGGTLIQTGTGDTVLTGSTLDNTGGRIAVNSAKLALTAETVTNRDGSIEHAGTGSLSIDAVRFDDERGKVTGNGLVDIQAETIDHRHAVTTGQQITVQADNLDNRDGTLQQTGPGQMRVDVAQALDNTGGNIAGNGGVQVQAAVVDNSKGRITSAASADITSKGALTNTDGVIAATQALQLTGIGFDNTRGVLQADNLRLEAASLLNQQGTVSAGSDLTARLSADLSNTGLLYAGRNQQLTVGGLLNNSGSIASVGNTNISANKVTSSGLLGAGLKADGSLGTAGDLTINADGVLQASGQNLAAGSAVLAGNNVDLSGSQTGASNIAITARSGDVLTNKAVISASNLLAITANVNNGQSLVNSQGQLVGGQLQLNVANVNNASGEIVQTGTGDTVIRTDKLDNTAGRIAVNSANLALNATVLTNINGKLEHAGAGVLAINAGQFNNQYGKITGNGKLDITAAAFDHRNATTVANQLTVNAGSLDNRAGSLAQTGTGLMSLNAAGSLDNTGGKIEGNGDALVKANTLLNNTGRIVAAQDATLNVDRLDNTEGIVAAGRNLALSGADIDNTKGQLQAVAGNAALTVANLNNAAGNVFAGGNLATTLDALSNTGSLYAAGNQSLTATGAIVNTGVIAAQGDTSITANRLDSSASSLIGAGIQADGKLGTSGDLAISTAQALNAHGQILAAGNANLTGTTLDISGSQASAVNIGLTATQGDVITNKAVVTTPGTLNVTTGAALHNTDGTLQAGQLDLHVANLDNAKGTLLQTGTGNTIIQTGNLDNTAGRIAVNSNKLTLDATTLTNRDGKIEHAGTGILSVQVGVLDNSKGRITSAASSDIVSNGALNNKDGVIAAIADLHVGGVALDNTRGVLQADNLRLDAATLLNQQGTLSAGTDLTAKVSGDLNNAGLLYAGRNQQWMVGGVLNNTGSIASVNNTHITAGKVTSSGLLGAGVKADGSLGTAGDLTINADGVLQATGQNLAAGNAVLTGANVDLSGSQTGAANLAITSLAGDVITSKAVISASKLLAITANAANAQSLINTQGQLVADQLQLNIANLDNANGDIVQTGTGDTVITTAKLDNTAGRIAVNSANLALNAMILTNINGKLEHAGAGILAINAGQFNNQFGKITGNGKVDLTAATLDHRNATTIANQLTVNAGTLDNRSGSLAQTGTGLMNVNATGLLDNTGGKIEGNGDALVKATTLLNNKGRIVAAQDAELAVGSLDNTDGTVAAGRNLALSGADIDNTKGQLQAVAGNATLTVANLNNAAGNVFAGSNLNATLASLNNTGSLYAAGNQSLTATGAIINTGVIAAQGNTSLTAKTLDSSASSLIGAGMQADGKLGTAGDLTINTAQTLAAHGQNLAAGKATLTGASIDIGGSQTSATNIGLTATQGDVGTNKAVVMTPGALNITTSATLHNTEGTLQAGQLDLHVGNLDNAKGTVLQTGTGDTVIQTGNLDNTAGRIAVNSTNLNIDAVKVTNQDGKIEHAGTGMLNVQAGGLDNNKGRITSAAAASVISKGVLNNTDGVIAATTNLQVSGTALDNTRGVLQADNLHLDAATLLNQQGTVSAGMDLTAKVSGDLNNAGLLYAGRNQQWMVGGVLNNTGSIASVNNTHITAGKVTSSGLLGAGVKADGSLGTAGDLTIHADGVLQASGQNLAAGSAQLTGASVDLSGSQTGATNIAITANTGDVVTNKAVISASNVLAITANAHNAQSLVNTQGQLVAGQLQLNVVNLNNASGDIVQTGTGDTVITTGKLDNTAGRIAVNSANLALNATVLTNINGKLEHAGVGVLAINAGQFNNQFGKITGNGKVDLTAATLDHRNATTVAHQLTVNAGSLDNRAGSLAQTGTGLMSINSTGLLDNTGGKIEGNGDALVKAGTLLNNKGRIVAAQDAELAVGSLDNTEGTVAAGRHLALSGGDVDNTKGQLQAVAGDATLNVGELNNNAGSVFAGANLNATLASLNNTGSLYAAGNQTLSASGAIVNTGVIAAQGNNSITANSFDSSASSLIGAGMQADGKLGTTGDLTINTAQTLAAYGQNLAAGSANLTGGSVDLSGSQTSAAKIGLTATTGDVSTNKAVVTTPGTLNITSNATLHNTEGTVQAGQLDLHVGNLDNAKGTVIQTGTGDTVIQTGNLDNSAGRIAVNSANLTLGAASLTNAGGKIEHAGSGTLAITAATLQGAGGSIIGNGAVDLKAGLFDHANATTTGRSLNVQADSLSNRGGHLLQTGAGGMTVAVTGLLDNTSGEIAGNGVLSVQTGSLDNTKGKITSATSADIASTGALVNTDGVIAAATDLHLGGAIDNTRGLLQAGIGALSLDAASLRNAQGTLSAGTDITAKVSGDVLNAGVLYAGRNQALDIGGLLSNTGSLAALGNTTITAGSLSGNGLLAAGMRADGSFASAGDLTVTAHGALQAGGQNMAAGQLQMTGASVDAGGSQTSATNIGLTALTGNVTTSKAVVSTNGLLSITANAANGQALVNQGGSLSAGQLALRVANLDNAKGTLIQTGAGDTLIETGKLDNTGGRIAVNSANLRLQAGDLTNIDGKIEHAGKGVLEIRATNLYGQRGQLTGNGALQVAANYIDHRNASLLAQQVNVSAGILDNRQGQITQLGTSAATVLASTRLDNSGGKIEANGNVRVETGELLNEHGRIASAQDVNVAATGKLDNTSGVIIAGRDLTLAGGKVDNTLGQLQAAGGNAQLTMDELLNAQGSIVASGNLTTTAGSVRNSGSLFAGTEQTLTVTGALENAGVILAQGNNTISANSVNSGAASLIGAGVKADGSLQTSGNLQVTAQQALGAHGQVLAAGNAVLRGGSVDLGGSRSSAGNISLTATSGDVSTSGAVVTTPGALTITAGANSQTWNNQRGDVSAGQLAVAVGNLNNQQGGIVQTGAGNTAIELTAPAGVLDNTGGRIAVNSANLSLKAGTLTNTDGKIEHAGSGTLSLQANQLNDLRGQITGNGALVVTAGAIDHRNASTIAQQISVTGSTLDNGGGNLTQLGKGDTTIQLTTSLDNRGGTIASNGNTSIVAPTLNNQGGKLQAAGTANLTVTASNVLDNSHGGAIAGGGNVVLGAGNLLNQGGSATAGGQLTANVAQAFNNTGGLLAATGNMTVNAASVDNSAGGKLASVQGLLTVTSTGATVNNGGTLQAGGDIILRNGGLWNGQGTIAGANVTLDTHGQVFNNTQGTLAGAGTVNLQTGILDNDGGLLQSGGAMTIDTHGNALLNTNAGAYAVRHPGSAGGISSGAGLTLQTGSWNNAGGYLGAAGNITGSVGQLDNRGGQLVGKSALDLALSGLQNQGGQIQVLGNIGLNAGGGSINNQQGLIRSGAAVTVTGGAIDNASTLGANQGIEGIHVTLNSVNVSNVQGAVRADGNLAINSAGIINNTLGMLSAGGALALQDTGSGRGLAVTNSGGTIIGGQRTDIRAGSLTGDGKVLSQKDMALDLAGNFTLNAGAEIMANGNADITIGGQLANAGKIQALSMLTLGAANFDNASTGDINAGTTRVNVGGVLNNRGVIDGISTQLNVGTLNNVGTGRIYGDHLSIAGGTVNNDVEGGVAATIAARERLDIGVTTLNNREHGLIFSGGDMAIGGYLDGNRIATGWAGTVTNASATIEALGSLNLGASQVNVLNNHLVFEEGRMTTETTTEYQLPGSDITYGEGTPGMSAQPITQVNLRTILTLPDRGGFVHFTKREVTRTSLESVVISSDPGRIIASNNLKINASAIVNDNSHIIAGGTLDMDRAILNNKTTKGQKTVHEKGVLTVFTTARGGNNEVYSKGTYTPFERTVTEPSSSASTSRNEGNANTGGQGTKPGSAVKSGVGGTGERIGGAETQVRTSAFSTETTEIRKADISGQGTSRVDGGGIVQKTDRAGNPVTDAAVGVTPGSKLDGATGIAADTGTSLNHVSTGAAGSVAAQGAATVSGAHGATGSTRTGDAARTVAVDTVSGARVDAASGAGQHGAGVDAALLSRSSVGAVTAVSGGNEPGGAAHGGVLGQAGELGTVNAAQLSGIAGSQASSHTGLGPVAGAGIAADQVQGKGGPGGIADAAKLGRAGEIATLAPTALAGVNGAQASTGTGLNPLKDVAIAASTGSAAHAGAVGGVGQVRMNGITQVKLGNPSTRAQVVRTTGSSLQIPNASLYKVSSAPSSRYLVETDPRFASYREWTGSDYLLNQVKNDPSVTQKRLGDGFYEQRLVREQVAELTGQRFVGDYTSDEQQYKALMDQGVAFAKQWDLRPGIALTAEQMAGLTSDIVWLVEQDVVLADGSTQKVLAPQVYVRVREGDIDGQGGLLAGKEVNLNLEGDLTNSGTIAGRTIVKLNAENIDNLGGRITGDAISAHARNDLNNISGTISANSELQVSAGRDINVKTSTLTSSGGDGKNSFSRTTLDNLAGLYVTGNGTAGSGNLLVSAGRDVTIAGASVVNTDAGGGIGIAAGRDIAVTTVNSGSEFTLAGPGKRHMTDTSSKETASTIASAGDIRLSAGDNIQLKAANVQAAETLQLSAERNIDISTARDTETRQSWYGNSSTKGTSQGSELGGKQIVMLAGNDINNTGGQVIATDKLIASAGRDINIVTTTVSNASSKWAGNSETSTVVDKVAGLYVTGTGEGNTLVAQAGRDMTLTGGVIANAGANGQTSLIAGHNLTLNTVAVASTHDEVRNADNYRKESKTGEVGSQIIGAGNVNLQAGHDLTARAADVQAGGTLGLVAGNDISLVNGFQNEVTDVASKSTKKGFWNKTTTTKHDVVDTTTAIGTSLGGSSVTVQAGHDLQVTGSSILSDDATKLLAGNNITIDAATNTVYELHHSSTKKSGFMSSGGIGFSYGTKTTTVDQERDATLQSGEARSSIGATGGALTMVAGNNVTIGGSDILAATDLDIIGKSVTIKPGQDNEKGKFEVKTTQDGLTLALGGSVISAIQTLQTMSSAASTAKDGRVTAMAAATAAMAAKDAAKDMMKEGGPSISISLTAGHSESQQTQTTASTTHSGSVLTGNNINITATGGGKDSNITILGSDLNAKNDIRLHADNNVNLLAAQDTESQHSKSSSLSASMGVQAIVSTKGTSFGFTASVSGSKGHEDGDGTTQLNTHVNAGDKLVISSGGDTNIKGAVASANQVIADIKGNLNVESLQDTAKFDSKNQSLSASGTVGFGASVSGSYSQSNMHNDYASVQEQSGIKAGDGGFQIKVGGNTDLKGAVISATEAGKPNSSLITSTLTHSDIANHAISKGSSVGVSGGMSFAGTGTRNENLTDVGGKKDATTAGLPAIVSLSENSSSTTRSGISGGTLVITDDAAQHAATGKGADDAIAGVNRDVTTGVDSSGKIGNNFDKAALQATMEVAKAFTEAVAPLAAKEIGDFAGKYQDAAQIDADSFTAAAKKADAAGDYTAAAEFTALAKQSQEKAAAWGDDGAYRLALHGATQGMIGALSGGGAGAINSVAGVAGGNLGHRLGAELGAKEAERLKLTGAAKDELINSYQQIWSAVGGAVAGLTAGGISGQDGVGLLSGAAQGGASANTVDIYNRQFHDNEKQLLKELKTGKNEAAQRRLDDAACALVHCSNQLSDANPEKAAYQAKEARGVTYYEETRILEATGLFKYSFKNDYLFDSAFRSSDAIFQLGKSTLNDIYDGGKKTGAWLGDEFSGVGRGAINLAYILGKNGPGRTENQVNPLDLPGNFDDFNGPTAGGSSVVAFLPQVLCRSLACRLASTPVLGGVGYKPGNAIFSNRNGESSGEKNSESSPDYTDSNSSKVKWVDERAGMGQNARDYNDSATGARSNPLTKKGQAPALEREISDEVKKIVRFDGIEGDVLIDRKIAVVTTEKSKNQALRQSDALKQNGLTGMWEVPSEAEAKRAMKIFDELKITNIKVRVVKP